MKTYIRSILFILLLATSSTTEGQRITNWITKSEKGNYIEGTYSRQVSSSFEAISFHEYFEDSASETNDSLFFHFTSPNRDSFLLTVQEIIIKQYYALQSKPYVLDSGINIIGPWRTKELISPLNISLSNLGGVLRVNNEEDNIYLPLIVSHHNATRTSNEYQYIFRLNPNINEIRCRVFKEKHKNSLPPKNLLIEEVMSMGGIGGSPIQVTIDKTSLKNYRGWVTVQLTLYETGSTAIIPHKFFFYHSK